MDLLGDNASVAILVLFGMFAVGIHSYNLYGNRVPEGDKSESKHFLDSLSLQTLGGRHYFVRGFVFYLFINEAIYLILSFSTLILQQSAHLIGQEDKVGALTAESAVNPLYPILASSIVIVASQMKPFSDVENAIRRLAHSIAGIPRALFEIQQRIKSLRMEDLTKPDSTESDTRGLYDLVNNARKEVEQAIEAAQQAGLPDNECRTLEQSMLKMLCLHSWTLGYYGEKIWVDERTLPINTFFKSMDLEKQSFCESVEKLIQSARENPTPSAQTASTIPLFEQWRLLARQCRALENKLSDVLGLMLLNKPDADLRAYPTLRKLRSHVSMRDAKPEMNAFGLSMLQGMGLATGLILAYLTLESRIKVAATTLTGHFEAQSAAPIQTLAPAPEPVMSGAERLAALESTFLSWSSELGQMLNGSLREVMEPAIVCLIAIGIGLLLRSLQLANRRWPVRISEVSARPTSAMPDHDSNDSDDSPNRRNDARRSAGDERPIQRGRLRVVGPPPVSTYLYLGALAYALTCAAVLSYRYVLLVVIPAIEQSIAFEDAAQLVNFSTFIPEIFLIGSSAFVCVWFACAYLDLESWKDTGWVHRSAFSLAALCGLLNLTAALATGTVHTGWSVVGAFLSPTLVYTAFFVRYARVMERYQTPEPVQATLLQSIRNRKRSANTSSARRAAQRQESDQVGSAPEHAPI